MKQALSPEVPARVRRGQFRAISLGVGASVLAMACSFGEIDKQGDDNISPPGPGNAGVDVDPTPDNGGTDTGTVNTPDPVDQTPNAVDPTAAPYNPDEDPFSTEEGKAVSDILRVNCGNCHVGQGASGDMGYILDLNQLITNGKVVPGNKEDSQIFVRMQQQTMPPAFIRDVRPTFGQIDLVGKFIDELTLPDTGSICDAPAFQDIDTQIGKMANDLARQDAEDQPFTRYLTVTYSSNAGECGRALQRQRYALFKGINSVSTNPQVTEPVAIDSDETIYRIDLRDFNWDRNIDLEDDGVVDFVDAWEAIIADDAAAPYAIQYQGDQADDLIADSGTNVPFLPVNAFIQASEFGSLYYSLIGGKANLFDFEKQVLNIDTAAEIADDNLMRAGFSNSGVSKQERVLNRFDSGVSGGLAYWISFDFNGGNGGEREFVAQGIEENVANENIFQNPLDFAFAGGEAIFNLPNGLQAYYVANAAGTRLDTAPIGVVIDPAQNNGLVTNGASCHSCHNAGMITFTDTVRQYVEDNRVLFDNDTYDSVIAQYPSPADFQKQMDRDSAVHVAALEESGVPAGTPDPISRTYLDFQLGDVTLEQAAGELSVPVDELKQNLAILDPRLQVLKDKGGYVSREIMDATFFDSVCQLQSVNDNAPANCQ
jgi:hypothetical protein